MAKGDNTGVGAADVELAEMLDDFVHKLLGLLNIGNVGFDGNGIGAGLHRLDLLDYILGSFFGVGVVDSNASATASQLKSHLLANATAYELLAY